jgi:hypothetical protein
MRTTVSPVISGEDEINSQLTARSIRLNYPGLYPFDMMDIPPY